VINSDLELRSGHPGRETEGISPSVSHRTEREPLDFIRLLLFIMASLALWRKLWEKRMSFFYARKNWGKRSKN